MKTVPLKQTKQVKNVYNTDINVQQQSDLFKKIMDSRTTLKGTVSRDFEGVKMISMDRIVVPDVPLDVYLF